MAKNLLYFLFLTLSISSCILSNHDEVKYLNGNQRSFLNYSELLQLTSKENVSSNISIDISKYNTVEKIRVFLDTICQQYENNDSLDKCWDNLDIRYNYKDNSFKPNKDEKYNVYIPAIVITCHRCFITFREMEEVEIEYRKDTVFINNYLQNIYDTLLYDNSEIIENKIDSMFNKKISQFMNICGDYKDYEHTDEMFNEYIDSLYYIPLKIRLTISGKYLITDLEPLFTIIYKSYLKSIDKQIFHFTKHKIEELTINEMKLFGKNIYLHLTISQPFYEIFLNKKRKEKYK